VRKAQLRDNGAKGIAMLGKPQGAQDRGVSWAGTWRSGGRVPAVRVVAALLLAPPGPAAAGWAAIETVAQLAGRRRP